MLKRTEEPSVLARRLRGFAIVALFAQLAILARDHRAALPNRRDLPAGRAMIERLRGESGPILVLGTGYYASMAGHPEIHAHTMALFDVLKTKDEARKAELTSSILEAIRSRQYSAVVLDRSFSFLPPEIEQAVRQTYRLEGPLFSDPAATWPKTGFANRPDELWVAR